MNKTYSVTLELEIQAESEEEAVSKFREEARTKEQGFFDVMGEPEE